jgi:threonine/homoserine/homoserine lactone efflux protein
MAFEQAAAFFLFALVAAVTPGPSNVLLTAAGARGGVRRGLPCLLGVSAGMGTLMFAMAYGVGQVLLAHPAIVLAIKLGGAAFLLWLAWKIASSRGGGAVTEGRVIGFGGAVAAALQWVNPKAWMVSAGSAATYLDAQPDSASVQALAFALVFVAAALPSGLVWLAFGAALQRLVRDPRCGRAISIALGAALAGSVAMILI